MSVKQGYSHLGLGKLKCIGMLVIGGIFFGLAYSQSPLFTSNQNQYFLHGLAYAGYGYLKTDWLANTADPTPVYSLLIELTYLLFRSDLPFYLYYLIILGIYFFCLIKLARNLTDNPPPIKMAVVGTLLLILHSALWRYFLTIALGPEWTYVFEGGLANQRLLGVVFQPSVFGVFLLVALYAFVIKRDWLGLLMVALAIYFHPTYLLAGSILVLSFLVNSYLEKKSLRFVISYSFAFLVLVSPVLSYVKYLSEGTSAEVVSQAHHLLVTYRIPHHAIVGEWFNITSIVQILIVILGIALVKRSSGRLFFIMVISAGLIALLSAVQYISSNDTLALAFPWRLSVILVPLATSVIIVRLINISWKFINSWVNIHLRGAWIIICVLLSIVVTAGIARFQIELKQQKTAPESGLINFVKQAKRPGDIYLIPPKMQDFRLASGAPIYIDFKSIPYRPEEVLEWYRRIKIIEDFYGSGFPVCSGFYEWAITEEVNHAVVFLDSEVLSCPEWKMIYKDQNYVLLQRTGK